MLDESRVLNERALSLLSGNEEEAWTWDAVNMLLALLDGERPGELAR